jgi:hypothetical protein
MGQTQKVEVTRTCDACSRSVTLIQGHVTQEELAASAGWIVLSKEHLIGVDQLMPIAKLACKTQCALRLLENYALELPKHLTEAN